MLKILQGRLQQYMNRELPDVQAEFRKGRVARDQIVKIYWIIEKAREFQKNIYFCFIAYTKALDCVDHNQPWKILQEMWSTRPPYLSPKKSVWKSRSKLELAMEQWTGSKLAKEYVKAVYFHPVYLTSVQSASCKMLSWMKHKLESRLPGEISTTSDMQMSPPLWQK